MPRIYLSPPHLSGRELDYVQDAIDSNWVAPLGPHVDAFEQELSAVTGVPHALALSSGTAALHLALVVLGTGRGDEVACSSFTFSASANPIVYAGATPVFVDSDPATWTLDPALLERALAERPPIRAVVAVDLYGQCCDYERIRGLCAARGVTLIQDATESLGALHGDEPAGAQGELAAFSFNGNKVITTSGGGMLVSRNADWIEHARKLSTQARDPAPHYQHTEIGFNYRLSNLLAAVGRAQLAVLSERVAARRRVNARYRELLAASPGISFMPETPYGRSNSWLTCIVVDPVEAGTDRERIRLALEAEDVESRPLWKPMHLQPVFADAPVYGGEVSARLFERGLCLPSGSALTDEDQRRVVEILLATRS
ncbi:MAG TPA: aminotransferase class I/II-fold pyridoxal phosphate-dependent enzyme [Gaiellaceae bacterium]